MFGQMYHHFHNDSLHKGGQGSIDAETFRSVLIAAASIGAILAPQEFGDVGFLHNVNVLPLQRGDL
jgi:hypothetical protein